MSSIQYRSLINDQGRLAVDKIPRQVYTRYVNEYRKQPSVIRMVFTELYFNFDLERKLDEAVAAGQDLDVTSAAELVCDEMEEGDWWRVLEAFEDHAIRHYADDPQRWSSIFDPFLVEQMT